MAKRGRRPRPGKDRALSSAAPVAARSSLLLDAATAFLPAILSVLAYANALRNPFVYDDVRTVVENPSLREPLNWRFVLLFSPFRPLVNVTYAVDAALWGLRPFGFHLTSLLLHAANAVLLYRLALGLARDARFGMPGDAGIEPRNARFGPARVLALATASLFAVHPLLTEAVGYTSSRSDVLCATFSLLALLLARRGLLTRRTAPWVGALVAWLLAVLSKETAAVLPLLFLAYDRLLGAGTPVERRRRFLVVHLPLLGLILAGGLYRLSAYLTRGEAAGLPRALWQQVATELPILWRYVLLLFVPAGQSIVHPAQRATSAFEPAVLLAAAGVVLVAVLAWRFRRREPLVALGLLWFPLCLAPSSLVPLVELMAEHRVYLASAGLLLAVGVGVARLDAWCGRRGRAVLLAALALLVAGLALLAAARNRVWSDPVTLWSDAAAKAPNTWAPHYALADELRERGRTSEAIAEYRRALEILPGDVNTMVNLGICLAQERHLDEARALFEKALELEPGSIKAANDLAHLDMITGRPEAARRRFQEILRRSPQDVIARMNLSVLAERDGDRAEALRLCREAQAIAPQVRAIEECVRRNTPANAGGTP